MFFTAVPKTSPKTVQSSKNAKNDQIIIPTFWTSHIRRHACEILFNTLVVFCGDLRMDKNRKLDSVTKNVFLAFLTNIWDPQNFTFASENGQTSGTGEK